MSRGNKTKKKNGSCELSSTGSAGDERWRMLQLPKPNGKYFRRYLNSASKDDNERNDCDEKKGELNAHDSQTLLPLTLIPLVITFFQFEGERRTSGCFRCYTPTPHLENLFSVSLVLRRLRAISRTCALETKIYVQSSDFQTF